jgi:hypothetical protein
MPWLPACREGTEFRSGVSGVEGGPEEVFEALQSLSVEGGDEDMGDVWGEFVGDGLSEFFVEHVGLADGDEEFLVKEGIVVAFEFAEEDVEFLAMVLAVGGYEEEEDGVAFDMSEESVAEAFAFGGSFDDAGEVGDAEGLSVAVFDHAELWGEGGEGVVGDPGFGGGDAGQEG